MKSIPKISVGVVPSTTLQILEGIKFANSFSSIAMLKNPANDKGITPLHLAVQNDDNTLCRVMLKGVHIFQTFW